MEKENEYWCCDFCGLEFEGQYWGLGRIIVQYDWKEVDLKWDVFMLYVDVFECFVVILFVIDVVVEDDGNGI